MAVAELIALSGQQMRILHLLADGHETPAIAGLMFISESTVKTHRTNLYNRLGARNAAQAVATAYERGLLGGDRSRRLAEAAAVLDGAPGHRLALVPWGAS